MNRTSRVPNRVIGPISDEGSGHIGGGFKRSDLMVEISGLNFVKTMKGPTLNEITIGDWGLKYIQPKAGAAVTSLSRGGTSSIPI